LANEFADGTPTTAKKNTNKKSLTLREASAASQPTVMKDKLYATYDW
jgi:hypothetical protein